MDLIACGFNGCVYENKSNNTVVKKFNASRAKTRNEILFAGTFVQENKHRLNLIPLLDVAEKPGLVNVPLPPTFKTWPTKFQEEWLNKNRNTKKNEHSIKTHMELTYPKITIRNEYKSMKDMYWLLSRKERYAIFYELLNTLKIMHENHWYNADIHSKNIIFGDDKVYLIDYGAVNRNQHQNNAEYSIISLCIVFGPIVDTVMFHPIEPKYDDWKEIKKRIKETVYFKSYFSRLESMYGKKLAWQVLNEIIWVQDYSLASRLTGFDKWIVKQSRKVQEKFGRPHSLGLLPEDCLFVFWHLKDINSILQKIRQTLITFF